jgi:chromosome partitioning protein
MYSYCLWTEGGGQGKTTIASGLVKAHVENGHRTLAVDLDGQKGGLSACYGLLNEEKTPNGETIVDFLADKAKDDLDELIRTREGIDFIPSTRQLRDLNEALYRIGGPRQKEVPDEQLRRIIEEYDLYKKYDVMVIDVPGGIDSVTTKNGLFAGRNVLVPTELNPKGVLSVDGLVENLYAYEQRKALEIGIVGLLPNEVNEQRNVVKKYRNEMQDRLDRYEEEAGRSIQLIPFNIGQRGALFEGAWDLESSPFRYHELDDRQPERNAQTLETLSALSDYVMYQLSNGQEGSLPDFDATSEQGVQRA